jgi:hypothetical protein
MTDFPEAEVDLLSDLVAGALSATLNLQINQAMGLFSAANKVRACPAAGKEMAVRGLRKFLETQDTEAVAILAAALGAEGLQRLKDYFAAQQMRQQVDE